VGEALLAAGAMISRRSANCVAQIMMNPMMKRTTRGKDIFDLIEFVTPGALGDQASSRTVFGKSPTNRAIAAADGTLSWELGNAESSEDSRSVAAAAGNLLRLAASRQGSRSSRASADTTLSNIPFRSSPIAAKRNESNAVSRKKGEVAVAMETISSIGSRRFDQSDVRRSERRGIDHRPSQYREAVAAKVVSETTPPRPPA
jgi:hypothetical protein